MIKTEKLSIQLISDEEMRKLISQEADEEMKMAYAEMLDGSVKNPDQRLWYGIWDICLKDGERIGDYCFT